MKMLQAERVQFSDIYWSRQTHKASEGQTRKIVQRANPKSKTIGAKYRENTKKNHWNKSTLRNTMN